MYDLYAHLHRQAAFSRATFGPGARTAGVQQHILREFEEINELEYEDDRAHEWVDVAILGLDGLLRSLIAANPTLTLDVIASRAVHMIANKQAKNEMRVWPDWRGKSENEPIEHDRSGE